MLNFWFNLSLLLPIVLVAVCIPEDDLRGYRGALAWLVIGTIGTRWFAELAGGRVTEATEALVFSVLAALVFFLIVVTRIVLLRRAIRRPS